jgi:hypothetical protein
MSESSLDAAVCSITTTQRRRFFWAAWWTKPPEQSPFQKPDASNGGAKTREEALAEAQRVAGRALREIDPLWARAWTRVLRGQEPFTPRDQERARTPLPKRDAGAQPAQRASALSVLGLERAGSAEELRRAYKKRALETHPDRGGDPEVFRAVQRAYERARAKLDSSPNKKRRARSEPSGEG